MLKRSYSAQQLFQTLFVQSDLTGFDFEVQFLSHFCRFFLALTLTTVWLGLESQINVRLLWHGHLLHFFNGTQPLVTNFSMPACDSSEPFVDLSFFAPCSLMLGLSAYETSKKDLPHPIGIHPYVTWLSPSRHLIRSVSWQPQCTGFPVWFPQSAFFWGLSEILPVFDAQL